MVDTVLLNLTSGMQLALSVQTLTYCTLGVVMGMFVGVLPGVGILATIALLMPMTFHLDPTSGIAMLAGIYYGAAYGGSTASILLNLPGAANNAVTCLDGYPMAQQGRAGIALFMTTIASFIGSVVGIAMLAAFSYPLAAVALRFGAQEYFALMLLGLVAASLMTTSSHLKSLASVALGLALGMVGLDINSGMPRFTFGVVELYDGLSIVAMALGLFGLAELMRNAGTISNAAVSARDITLRSMLPTREDWRRSTGAMSRGTFTGAFFGVLPGTGGMIASFISYAVERRVHRRPEEFGKGAIEGIAGPEAANNAAIQTAFIPTLTLGIPGDAVMALMLGVLMIHGIAPGPQFLITHSDMFWGLVVSFLFGNLLLLILNIPLIGIWIRVLTIPYSLLFPAIVGFLCIGVYSVNYSLVDLIVLIGFGVSGYVLFMFRFPIAPLLLGFILGPMMEENFRRAMLLQRGDVTGFLDRPLATFFLAIIAVMLIYMPFSRLRKKRAIRRAAKGS